MYLHDCLRDNTHLPAQRYFAQQVLDSLLDVSLCVHTIPLFIWFFFFCAVQPCNMDNNKQSVTLRNGCETCVCEVSACEITYPFNIHYSHSTFIVAVCIVLQMYTYQCSCSCCSASLVCHIRFQ